MTKEDFAKSYEEMMAIYGKKDQTHFDVWYRLFGNLDAHDFAEQVGKVMIEHQSQFWPTPGQFDLIVNGPWTQDRIDREWAKNDTTYSDLRRRIDGAS